MHYFQPVCSGVAVFWPRLPGPEHQPLEGMF